MYVEMHKLSVARRNTMQLDAHASLAPARLRGRGRGAGMSIEKRKGGRWVVR